jgi:xanthine dehydrogenase molybdenum-binding subunit
MVATPHHFEPQEFKVIGTNPIRPDGLEKVTGQARYGADVRMPGLLYARMLRSPHAHARIKRIDYSKALELPGVKAVVTREDLPDAGDRVAVRKGLRVPLKWAQNHLMAGEKVLHVGHPIAAVAASDPHIAEDALDLIEVEYEVLPPVMTAADAIAPDAPILHNVDEAANLPGLFDPIDGKPTNVGTRLHLEKGDVDEAFKQADVIIEREFSSPIVHQGYIEPHNATAEWARNGHVTVWTSTQGHFQFRLQIAEIIGKPVSDVTVVPMEIGGGFGAKNPAYLEAIVAVLSRKAGNVPVQMIMTRTEEFLASGPTNAGQMRCKLGATRDGKLVAAELHLVYESGAFAGAALAGGGRSALNCYDIEHQRVTGYETVVNTPKVHSYRAPGFPQALFAVEGTMDELAEELGIEPLELRQRNLAREGTRGTDGIPHGSLGSEEVVEALVNSAHWRSELHGENRGRGIAFAFWHTGGGESSCFVNVNPDGTVNLTIGSIDTGGGQKATSAMAIAETLGITYEDVKTVKTADTDSIGFNQNTNGSRVGFASTIAAREAALDVRRQMEERAARIWQVETDQVTFGDDGVITGPGEDQKLTFKELAGQLQRTGGLIQGRADVSPRGEGDTFAAAIADVEVDPGTGKLQLERFTIIQDVGNAMHPHHVESQIQGGAVQGIGWAMYEGYVYNDEGQMLNASFLDYRMPTMFDMPDIEVIMTHKWNEAHPFGVRGVGEITIGPPLAAITNAIYDAVGVRVRDLPAEPSRILELLEEKRAQEGQG